MNNRKDNIPEDKNALLKEVLTKYPEAADILLTIALHSLEQPSLYRDILMKALLEEREISDDDTEKSMTGDRENKE